jgi:hypothetical protein
MSDIIKGKKKRPIKVRITNPCPTGAHDVAEAMVSAKGRFPGNASNIENKPLVSGHAADSAGNAGNAPGSRALAFRHHDLRQSSTDMTPFASARPAQTQGYLGAIAMTGEGHRQGMMLATQEPSVETLSRLTSQAPETTASFRAPRSGDPSRTEPRTARGSATKPNGTHSLDNPTSRRPMASSVSGSSTANPYSSRKAATPFDALAAMGVNVTPVNMDSLKGMSN